MVIMNVGVTHAEVAVGNPLAYAATPSIWRHQLVKDAASGKDEIEGMARKQ